MKNHFLLLLSILIAGSLTAQKKSMEVPAAAKNAFQKSFTGATKVKWEKEENDFEVNFTMNSKKMSAVYTQTGEMKEKEEEINASEIPAAAHNYLKEHYHGSTIKEPARIIKRNGVINYEVEVNKKDVIFDQQGKFLEEEKD